MNAEISGFNTVEYRVLLQVELQIIKKYLLFLRRGLSSTIRSPVPFFPCPVFVRNHNLVTHWSMLCFFTIVATHEPLQASPEEVPQLKCTSMGLNLLTQSRQAATVLFFLSYLGAAYPAGV